MLTKQEAFDTVAKHLFAQGKPAANLDEDGEPDGCFYRTVSGLKCGIGALIPDEQYKEIFEGCSASTLVPQVMALRGVDGGLLDSLQGIHDFGPNWYSDDAMRKALRDVAAFHDIQTAILDTLSFNRSPS